MADVTLKRKRKVKEGGFLDAVKNFVLTHVLTEADAERGEARQRRYVMLCTRIAAGCIFSALLSRSQLAFSIYPFGIVFLCSAGRLLPLYSLVSLITYLTVGGVSNIYAAVCALILCARSVLCMYFDAKEDGVRRFPEYNEWVAYRVIASCISSFVIGLYNLFFFSFTYYSLLGSLLCMTVCPVGTYIFCCGFDKTQREELRDVARLFMCAVFVWSLADISLFGVSVGRVAAFCLTAAEAKSQRKGAAALMGLVCGLPFSISDCAVYAISGALCAAMSILSSFLGNLGAFTFLVMSKGYIGGYSALVGALPSATAGLCGVLVWQKYDIGHRISRMSVASLVKKEESERTERKGSSIKSMEDVSRAFSTMSDMLKALSSRSERQSTLDTRAICDIGCERVCVDCPKRTGCWETSSTSAEDAFYKMSAVLARDGKITEATLPEYLRSNCKRSRTVMYEVNKLTASATEECFKRSSADLFACDYDAMSRILGAHLKKAKEQDKYDKELSDALLSLCRHKLYGIGNISVYGSREKHVFAQGIELSSHTVSASAIRTSFERVCCCRLSSPVYSIDGSDIEFEMHTVPAYSVKSAIAALPKEGEKCSGDSARTLTNSDGYFYGILCDGMGSGSEAAYTSGVCAEYLSNMLGSANPKELTIEMLNAVIKEDGRECSSTVDLFEFDTYNGEGCFIKSGAAPSFVCRQKNVYRVTAKTIPIGITDRIGAEKIKFRLRRGDIVVMVSDGIVEGPDEGRLIVEALCRRTTDDPFDIAASVLAAAKTKHNLRDDMTVLAISIEGAEEE